MRNNRTTIYFKYGSMNSGKSLELIKVAFNYKENSIESLILKPRIDIRKPGFIFSRTGLELKANEFDIENSREIKDFLDKVDKKYSVILVEEANFLSPDIVDILVEYAYNNEVNTLMFFGLKNDFRGNLFEGSKRIIEIADKIEESTSICWCGKKARQNARVINNELIKSGPTVLIDNNQEVNYEVLCNYHFWESQLKPWDKNEI